MTYRFDRPWSLARQCRHELSTDRELRGHRPPHGGPRRHVRVESTSCARPASTRRPSSRPCWAISGAGVMEGNMNALRGRAPRFWPPSTRLPPTQGSRQVQALTRREAPPALAGRRHERRTLDGRHPRIVTFSVDRLSAPLSFQPFRRRSRWHQGCSSDVRPCVPLWQPPSAARRSKHGDLDRNVLWQELTALPRSIRQ
jgi:hypothetical protein